MTLARAHYLDTVLLTYILAFEVALHSRLLAFEVVTIKIVTTSFPGNEVGLVMIC